MQVLRQAEHTNLYKSYISSIIFDQVNPKAVDFDLTRSPSVIKSQFAVRHAENCTDSDDSGCNDGPTMLPGSADAFRQCASRLLRRSLTTLGPRPPASFPTSLYKLSTPGNVECHAGIYHGDQPDVNLDNFLPSIKRQTF